MTLLSHTHTLSHLTSLSLVAVVQISHTCSQSRHPLNRTCLSRWGTSKTAAACSKSFSSQMSTPSYTNYNKLQIVFIVIKSIHSLIRVVSASSTRESLINRIISKQIFSQFYGGNFLFFLLRHSENLPNHDFKTKILPVFIFCTVMPLLLTHISSMLFLLLQSLKSFNFTAKSSPIHQSIHFL